MRSLSGALEYRHHREGAARHRPVGRGCRDDHARRHLGGRERDHTTPDPASACEYDPAWAGRGRGGRRVRPGGTGGVRYREDQDNRKVRAARGYGGSPPGSCPPANRGVGPRARQVIGTQPRSAPGWRSDRRQRSRRARQRSAFGSTARAEADERVLTGRSARRAQGRSRARDARRSEHPGNPADRRTPADSRSAGRRLEPEPAVARPGWTSSAASWLPAGDEPGRSRAGAVCPRRSAATPHAAP
jgi:hypothetical protein